MFRFHKEGWVLVGFVVIVQTFQAINISSNNYIVLRQNEVVENVDERRPTVPDAGPGDQNVTSAYIDERRPCRVIVENKPDFHHEILESVVKRFPLPWQEFNCSIEKPIIYNFALHDKRFAPSRKKKHLNETEFWGWHESYFKPKLQKRTFDRNHRTGTQTKAYFGRLMPYDEIASLEIDAWIDASCDISGHHHSKLRKSNFYCVLHGEPQKPVVEYGLNKSCFLSPMYPNAPCHFIAADLPIFEEEETIKTTSSEIRVCASGILQTEMHFLAPVFSGIPYEKYNVKFSLMGRSIKTHELALDLRRTGIEDRVTFPDVKDYLQYYRAMAECDIILPLREPENPKHYPWGGKKSTGIIPIIVGYKTPSVMHEEFEEVYHNYLTGPVEVYSGNTTESKVEALTRMLIRVSSLKQNK